MGVGTEDDAVGVDRSDTVEVPENVMVWEVDMDIGLPEVPDTVDAAGEDGAEEDAGADTRGGHRLGGALHTDAPADTRVEVDEGWEELRPASPLDREGSARHGKLDHTTIPPLDASGAGPGEDSLGGEHLGSGSARLDSRSAPASFCSRPGTVRSVLGSARHSNVPDSGEIRSSPAEEDRIWRQRKKWRRRRSFGGPAADGLSSLGHS